MIRIKLKRYTIEKQKPGPRVYPVHELMFFSRYHEADQNGRMIYILVLNVFRVGGCREEGREHPTYLMRYARCHDIETRKGFWV